MDKPGQGRGARSWIIKVGQLEPVIYGPYTERAAKAIAQSFNAENAFHTARAVEIRKPALKEMLADFG